MSVLFTNAVLAPLALLIAAPLLIHLFARSRPPAYRFSAVAFVLRVTREALRLKRPQDMLLLALRTLVVALLVLAFLQPLLFADRRLATPFEQRTVVVVVDATASMAYSDGAQSRFAQACAQASEILGGLSSRDRANVVWLKPRPEAVFPEMSPNLAHLRATLQRARVSAGTADPAAALDIAAALLAGAEGHREICLVSDFQKSVWQDFAPPLLPGIELVTVRVGTGDGENGAIMSLAADPALPLRDEPATLLCEIANFSPKPKRRTVFLEMQDSRQAVTVALPAWGRATAAFPCRFTQAGPRSVTVSLDEDGFPVDDRRWGLVDVIDRLRVALIGAQTGTGTAWRRAMEATGWMRVTPVGYEGLDADENWDAIMAAEWDGQAPEALRQAASRGVAVVVSPSKSLMPGNARALLGLAGRPGAAAAWEEGGRMHSVRVGLADDPLFSIFATGTFGDPARGRFRARLALPADALDGADLLMRYHDGIPALARSTRQPVYFWNMPLGEGRSTWPAQPEFVLLLGELLLSHRPASMPQDRVIEYLPGDTLSLRLAAHVPAEDVRLRRGSEDVGDLNIRRRDDTPELAAENIMELGLYTWQYKAEPLAASVVNFPPVESDLRAGDPRDLVGRPTVRASGGHALRLLREGRSLWPLLIGLCAVVALVEGLVAWWSEWA